MSGNWAPRRDDRQFHAPPRLTVDDYLRRASWRVIAGCWPGPSR